jgi:sirohydrochlorin ferrochelatase
MIDAQRRGQEPALVTVAHGTRDPRGAATVRALLDRVRRLAPELTVVESYVELTEPSLAVALPVAGWVVTSGAAQAVVAPGTHNTRDPGTARRLS